MEPNIEPVGWNPFKWDMTDAGWRGIGLASFLFAVAGLTGIAVVPAANLASGCEVAVGCFFCGLLAVAFGGASAVLPIDRPEVLIRIGLIAGVVGAAMGGLIAAVALLVQTFSLGKFAIGCALCGLLALGVTAVYLRHVTQRRVAYEVAMELTRSTESSYR